MSEPIRKKLTALDLGQECLAEACAEWREQPRTALASALEKAPPELAADLLLAAVCALVDAAVRDADDAAVRLALTKIALALEGMGGDLDAWHRERCARWEKRA